MKQALSLLFLSLVTYSYAQILQGSATLSSGNNMDVMVTVNTITDVVDIELTGPSSQWHAVGFGGFTMTNTYSLIIDGSGVPEERKLGNHSPGTSLTSSLTGTNTSVNGMVRTTTMSRNRIGMNANYYTFPNTASAITLIWAKGNGSSLSNHGGANRGSMVISLSNICNIPVTSLTDTSICNGDSAMIFGSYYSSPGVYYDTLTTSSGCDSVLSKELKVLPNGVFPQPDISICQGDSAMIFGSYYTTSGIYYDTLSNSIGCDSILSIELKVNPTGTFPQPDVSICDGDSIMIFGEYRNVSGLYTDTLSNSMSCDSIVTQKLTVNIVDTTISVSNDTLYAHEDSASYQWYDCTNKIIIAGETMNYYYAAQANSYAVIITKNNCTDTSRCVEIAKFNVNEWQQAGISVYPNPASDILHIQQNGYHKNSQLLIYLASGQLIKVSMLETTEEKLNVSQLPAGIYVVQFKSETKNLTQKIVIQ